MPLVQCGRIGLPGLKLPEEKLLKKQRRGTSYEITATFDGIDMSIMTWLDNKVITIASTYLREDPIGKCSLYGKKKTCRNSLSEAPWRICQVYGWSWSTW